MISCQARNFLNHKQVYKYQTDQEFDDYHEHLQNYFSFTRSLNPEPHAELT